VCVVVGTSDECKNLLKRDRSGIESLFETNKFFPAITFIDDVGFFPIIWLSEEFGEFDFSIKENYSLLSHEILHAISQMFRKIGIEYNEHTEEVYTYTQQWVFNEICNKLEKRK
jgi:hypothetical protein